MTGVVADTSPLVALHQISLLRILPALFGVVQIPEAVVTIQFDTDPKAARPQRRKAYADAAKKGYFVAVAHVSFPGIGQLRADGKGYRWLPANYTANLPPPPAK